MAVRSSTLFRFLARNQLGKLSQLLDDNNVNAINPGGYSLLHEAVSKKNADAVRLLLDAKAQANCLDPEGNFPLLYAASYLHTEITRLLLDAGANPNLKNFDGNTVLRWAITRPYAELDFIKLLLRYGADPWIENNAGVSTVAYAERVYPDVADELKRMHPRR